jgi:hypothetical protein
MRLQSVKAVSSNLTRCSKLLELFMLSNYLYSMREQFEITTDKTDLTVVRDGEKARYTLNDGDTILTLITSEPSMNESLAVSKFNNASIKVTITIEHDDAEYKNVQP